MIVHVFDPSDMGAAAEPDSLLRFTMASGSSNAATSSSPSSSSTPPSAGLSRTIHSFLPGTPTGVTNLRSGSAADPNAQTLPNR